MYDVLHHIMGRAGEFSGIPLHVGHFRSHVDETIKMKNPTVRGFFQPKKWLMFIQSAIAARLMGLPSFVREPCCELKVIGGDGTAIGVCLGSMDEVKPVWEPPGGVRQKVKEWGSMDRCAIGNGVTDSTPRERDDARTFVRSSTDTSNTSDTLANLRQMLDSFQDTLPQSIFDVLEAWFSTDSRTEYWEPVRRILRACSYKDSLCGSIGIGVAPVIRQAVALMLEPQPLKSSDNLKLWEKCMREMKMFCKSVDLASACDAVKREFLSSPSSNRRFLVVFSSLLEYIGKSIHYGFVCKSLYMLPDLTRSLIIQFSLFMSAQELESQAVDGDGKKMDSSPLPQSEWLPRPNAATTGIRYIMTSHGCSVRTSWPLPPSSETKLDTERGSSDGCRKVRFRYQGHRQRAGLWVYMCMTHETIVGFHVMKHGEGRRDGIIPPYRFMETPPEAIFGDYVCGWEETALNLLPEFYMTVQFFHDIFHGVTHKCSERFLGKHLSQFASINTSLMEQVSTFTFESDTNLVFLMMRVIMGVIIFIGRVMMIHGREHNIKERI